jgi:hypothetical protein
MMIESKAVRLNLPRKRWGYGVLFPHCLQLEEREIEPFFQAKQAKCVSGECVQIATGMGTREYYEPKGFLCEKLSCLV